jgi:nucleotide-binding universal stress UspA family protein
MRGTLICGVNDNEDGRAALDTAVELSDRLGLRLVLAYARHGIEPIDVDAEGAESVSMRANREGAARVLARLSAEYGIADSAEHRSGTGDAATLIGQVAAEEAADVIVVGSRKRRGLRRGLESRLAEQLQSETPVPVVIAPPRRRAARVAGSREPALTSSW